MVQQNQSISGMELMETDRGMYWQRCCKWWSISKIRMTLQFHRLISNIYSWNNKHELPFYDLFIKTPCATHNDVNLQTGFFGFTYWKYYAISYRNLQLVLHYNYIETIAYDYLYVSISDAVSWQCTTLMQGTWQSSINLLWRNDI